MNDSDARRERIKAKVEASQARLKRDGGDRVPAQKLPNLPDAYPPENYRTLASEYPLLTMGFGLGLGLLAGALLPKRRKGKFGKRAVAIATAATEIAFALGKHARDTALEAERAAAGKTLGTAAGARRQASRLAEQAGGQARQAAIGAVREAARLAARVRKAK